MNPVLSIVVGLPAVGAGLWLASLAIEAMRRVPKTPSRLPWAPAIPIEMIDVGGHRLRFIKTGQGPSLVLLHTLRTQLDLFEKVIPELSRHFTVYALDYPGHGFSDIPRARYDAAFFTAAVEGFIERLELRDVTLAGVSIGGATSLIIAARRNPRVARVVAVNPYDYAKGRGMARSSVLGWLVTHASRLPVIGETVMRMRNFFIMRSVFRGGVADGESIPPALLEEMYVVGNRPGHYRAFLSLLRNSESWERATRDYHSIVSPVLFVWGAQDWARPSERERDRTLIPSAEMTTIEHGGHFLPLDRPQELTREIRRFTQRSERTS